ncbi:hypothetical protein HPP92_023995 [Vanilla planifolia]|uniref:NAC domain-containing protein n=1 Tax=Vanilla planifolia TaxID=51239 RepID=A0A835UB14_VANPL|nr:hypothetical protein HPP92_023995 [Vanilla planifolia]
MSRSSTDLIDAKLEEHGMSGTQLCPSCGHRIERKPDWVGLPAGVKFDPSDQELIEHLEAKVPAFGTGSHPLIDEFIPTIEGEDGICYTHPEKLPGVTRDGLSKHFFHRPSKAYTTGTRKRRKIQAETRWHKTGKTRPVTVGGRQKGCKKILVLYTNFGKHRKPEKTNWVMHQYHLGEMEEEKEGELVVSKIFYQTQPRQCGWSERTGGGSHASCCTSKKGTNQPRHELGSVAAVPEMAEGSDRFSFSPFGKTFEEVVHGKEEQLQPGRHRCQQPPAAGAAFHVSRPNNPISTVVSPSTLHKSSMVLDDAFHISRILLQEDNFQHQPQQQQKPVERSAGAGLEEMIMGCTSTDIKSVTSIPHTQEAEWLKYSSYWSPDNQDHHG